jgi:serine phosphatase RsbU (regulator of sigma subunit)
MGFRKRAESKSKNYVRLEQETPLCQRKDLRGGANTQGATLEQARENLREAVELVLEANRAMTAV